MDIQVRIPPALCAIHNFIRRYDPDEISFFDDDIDDFQPGCHAEGHLATEPPNRQVREQASTKRDQIAQQMWEDYLAFLAVRGDEAE